jgi:hypothetical protein
MPELQQLDPKDYKKYIRIIKADKSIGEKTWNDIVTDFHTNIQLNPGSDKVFTENNCIVKYHNETKDFTMYNFNNEEFAIPMLINSTRTPVTEDDMIKYGKPLFEEFLRQIQDMTASEIKNDYFFLVRLVTNDGSPGKDLQAEGWHHDYMWAPAHFSSIIYTSADNILLQPADFCIYGQNKSKKGKGTFGTDSWGPGIGSYFTREEIYAQYKIFLKEHAQRMKVDQIYKDDPNKIYYIAIKVADNQIAKAKILDFDETQNKIIFKLEEYNNLPDYLTNYTVQEIEVGNEMRAANVARNNKLVPEDKRWWNLQTLKTNLDTEIKKSVDHHISKIDEDTYSVLYDSWDESWKIRLTDINPGSLSFNLLRGKDKFEEEDIKESDEKSKLIYTYFSLPLYREYQRKNGVASGCPNTRYFDEFKDSEDKKIKVNLNDGIFWDNENTWHRSPFKKVYMDPAKKFKRSFINIRIIRIDDTRPTPYESSNLDFSQFQQKYLKYKQKYLNLKKKLIS